MYMFHFSGFEKTRLIKSVYLPIDERKFIQLLYICKSKEDWWLNQFYIWKILLVPLFLQHKK